MHAWRYDHPEPREYPSVALTDENGEPVGGLLKHGQVVYTANKTALKGVDGFTLVDDPETGPESKTSTKEKAK